MAKSRVPPVQPDGPRNRVYGPFNTPLESGLRALCILYEAFPTAFDSQRLVFFDYLVVHSGDVPDGPESLHPPTPFRSNEWVVRRQLIERGLQLFMGRGLLTVSFSDDGFMYAASEAAASFMKCLEARYTKELRHRAEWAVQHFGDKPEGELIDFFNRNLDRWGAEFEVIGDIEGEG